MDPNLPPPPSYEDAVAQATPLAKPPPSKPEVWSSMLAAHPCVRARPTLLRAQEERDALARIAAESQEAARQEARERERWPREQCAAGTGRTGEARGVEGAGDVEAVDDGES